jgi:class 3 adenylate cyclase
MMAFKDELETAVKRIFRDAWDSREGRVVPALQDLGLGNDAVELDATVLYADIADSTKLVDTSDPEFAAQVYRSYLTCAARIVKANSGVITAYDGDCIMAVFLGDLKNSNAAKAAMQINKAVLDIINPSLAAQYPNATYRLKHVIGIDTSLLFVARIGVRNDNVRIPAEADQDSWMKPITIPV